MGWTITLENENGFAIKTLPFELEINLSGSVDLEKYKLLKYIDPYGDTIFNSLQMPDLITDFTNLINEIPHLKKEIEDVISIADVSKKSVHQYLKFCGD